MKKTYLLVGVLILALLISACGGQPTATPVPQPQPQPQPPQAPTFTPVDAAAINTTARTAVANPEVQFVYFQGDIVASARVGLVRELWQQSGWSVLDETINSDSGIPSDCILRKMEGVEDQWIGRCRGYIMIPKSGAQNIAVVIDDSDVVQVAPPPTGP